MKIIHDSWSSGDPYEYFMGRWSKLMAPKFLQWLQFPPGKSWIDLGCGTGALSEAITNTAEPERLVCVDPSAEFISKAQERQLHKAEFYIGTATQIPVNDNSFDIVVTGLSLNFFPDLASAFTEMKRVLKQKGIIAAYVWDYAGKMEFLRLFWETAGEIDKEAYNLDEGNRFTICNIEKLQQSFENAGLTKIESTFLDINTIFKDFNDFWDPFLGGQGPAPGYLASLSTENKAELKSAIQKKLTMEPDGSIKLIARAIAIQGQLK